MNTGSTPESFFRNRGIRYHQIAAYFSATLLAPTDHVSRRFESEIRRWAPQDEAVKLDVKPAFVKQLLHSEHETIQHIVLRED
jgi:hypothetical protein